jgi:endonuclease YncB( thermonuclease family)
MKRLTGVVIIIALAAALGGCGTVTMADLPEAPTLDPNLLPVPTPTSEVPVGEEGVVTDVVDGDTIEVSMNGEAYQVRYIGINTPEWDEPCGEEATAANALLVSGQTVTLVRDVSETDQYGRLLRYVYVGDLFVNEYLVAQGWAEAREYPPDTAFNDEFEALEADAIAAGLGCHPTGVFGD